MINDLEYLCQKYAPIFVIFSFHILPHFKSPLKKQQKYYILFPFLFFYNCSLWVWQTNIEQKILKPLLLLLWYRFENKINKKSIRIVVFSLEKKRRRRILRKEDFLKIKERKNFNFFHFGFNSTTMMMNLYL